MCLINTVQWTQYPCGCSDKTYDHCLYLLPYHTVAVSIVHLPTFILPRITRQEVSRSHFRYCSQDRWQPRTLKDVEIAPQLSGLATCSSSTPVPAAIFLHFAYVRRSAPIKHVGQWKNFGIDCEHASIRCRWNTRHLVGLWLRSNKR